jgi:hypothetical protein
MKSISPGREPVSCSTDSISQKAKAISQETEPISLIVGFPSRSAESVSCARKAVFYLGDLAATLATLRPPSCRRQGRGIRADNQVAPL